MYLPSLGWDFRVRLDLTATDESVALRHPALIVLPDRAPAWLFAQDQSAPQFDCPDTDYPRRAGHKAGSGSR
jgi:hypothetical protein